MQKLCLFAAGFAAVLSIAMVRAVSAAPQQLNCILTDTAEKLASENRPVVVIIDDAANTLTAQAGGQNYSFDNVSISNIAISGNISGNSVGIDRSSFGIVWQQYGADRVATEFGQCANQATAGPATTPH